MKKGKKWNQSQKKPVNPVVVFHNTAWKWNVSENKCRMNNKHEDSRQKNPLFEFVVSLGGECSIKNAMANWIWNAMHFTVCSIHIHTQREPFMVIWYEEICVADGIIDTIHHLVVVFFSFVASYFNQNAKLQSAPLKQRWLWSMRRTTFHRNVWLNYFKANTKCLFLVKFSSFRNHY